MKKKVTFALLSTLFALTLVSCQTGEASSSSPISSSTPTASSSSAPKTSSSSSSPTKPASSSSENPQTSTSSSTDIYSTTKWKRSVVDKMLEHLGGQLIPYMKLPNDTNCEYEYTSDNTDTGHLLFVSTYTLSQDELATIQSDYSAAGYNSIPSSGGFVFLKDTLRVSLTQKSGEGLTVTVSYSEPYATKEEDKQGTWSTQLISDMTSSFHQHALPFFYLGTTQNYYYELDATKGKITIVGQTFQDAFLADMLKSFQSQNMTSIKSTGSSISATLAFGDGCQYALDADGIAKGGIKRCRLSATFKESFDPTRYSKWSNDVQTDLTADLDNHSIPFIYLGNDSPSYSFNRSSDTATLKGRDWDSACITNASSVFEANNWTVSGEDTATSIAREIVESDGCVLHAEVFCGTSNLCTMTIHISRAMSIPEDATSWSDETLQKMNTNLKNTIPYIYLNLATLSDPVESAYYSLSSHTLTINGGNYNDNILPNAEKVLKTDTWTTSYDDDGNLLANKTFRKKADDGSSLAGDGETLEVQIYKRSSYTAKASIAIRRKEVFDASTQTDWPSDVKKDLNDISSSSDFPFVYLGTEESGYYTSEDTRNSTLTVTGNTWDDSLIETFKTVYTAKEGDSISYAVTQDEKTPSSLTAIGAKSDGQEFKVTLSKNSNDSPVMTFHAEYPFDPDNAPTEWPQDIKDGISTNLTSNDALPVIYLGTKNPTGSFNSYNNSYSITGGYFNRQVFSLAKAKFESEGWTVQENYTGIYGKALAAYKTFTDGSLRAVLAANNSSATAKAFLQVYFDAAITPDDASTLAFTDDQKSTIQGAFGEDLPYIFPKGIKTVKARTGTALGYALQLTAATSYSSTNRFNFNNILYAKNKLDTEHPEYKTELTLIPDDATSHLGHGNARLTATKELADGSKIVIAYGYNSSVDTSAPAIFVSHLTGLTNANNITDWDSKTRTNMNFYFGLVLPYFYTGVDEVKNGSYYSSYRWMSFTGGYYDTSMSESFKNAFKNDTAHTWTMDHSNHYLVNITSSGGGATTTWVKADIAKTTLDGGSVVEVAFYEYKTQASAKAGYSTACFLVSLH